MPKIKWLDPPNYIFFLPQRYDSHFLVKAMLDLKDRIHYKHILPYNSEQYRAITIDQFTFMDSYQFMSASLDKLMDNLRKTVKPSEMSVINSCRGSMTNGVFDIEKRNLQLSKGLVPWGLVNGRRHLKTPRKTLPLEKEHYFSDLTESYPEEAAIEQASKYYQKYECKNLLDYIMFYCETDTVQLAECFHNFRMKLFKFANLDILKFVGKYQKFKLIRTMHT